MSIQIPEKGTLTLIAATEGDYTPNQFNFNVKVADIAIHSLSGEDLSNKELIQILEDAIEQLKDDEHIELGDN